MNRESTLAQTFEVVQKSGIILRALSLSVPISQLNDTYTIEQQDTDKGVGLINLGKNLRLDLRQLTPEDEPSSLVIEESILNSVDNIPARITSSYVQLFLTWNYPIHLQPGKYCFTVFSNSSKLKLLTGEVGELDNNNKIVSKPSNVGNLYTYSMNGWSEHPNKTLMFTLYRAKFPVADTAVYSVSVQPSKSKLKNRAITTSIGLKTVRIELSSHSMLGKLPDGNTRTKTQISGVTGNIGGISAAAFNKVHDIVTAGTDYFTIELAEAATASVKSNQDNMYVTKNVTVDSVRPIVDYKSFVETDVTSEIEGFVGPTLKNNTTFNRYRRTTLQATPNQYLQLDQPLIALAPVNRTDGSIDLNVNLSTNNEYVSPIINTDRTQALVRTNRINNPKPIQKVTVATSVPSGSTSLKVNEDVSSFAAGYFIRGTGIQANTTLGSISVGNKTITLSKTTDEDIASGTEFFVLSNEKGYSYEEEFVDETSPHNGSSLSRYVTGVIPLGQEAKSVIVDVKVNRPTDTNIELYYRGAESGLDEDLSKKSWTKINTVKNTIPISENPNEFSQVTFLARRTSKIESVQLKFVFTSQISTKVPSIKGINLLFA